MDQHYSPASIRGKANQGEAETTFNSLKEESFFAFTLLNGRKDLFLRHALSAFRPRIAGIGLRYFCVVAA